MIKSSVIFTSETKIDETYPNSQFSIPGRKKGGGRVLASIQQNIFSKEIDVQETRSDSY